MKKPVILLFILISNQLFAQDPSDNIISRKAVSAAPSLYPNGLYMSDSENDSPYLWPLDAGIVLGMKPAHTNFRHAQLLIGNNPTYLRVRMKNGSADSWTTWRNFVVQHNNGNYGIDTPTPSEKLEVNGTIRSKEVKVEATGWPDYVFKEDYPLQDLSKLKEYITINKHLPNIPTETEVKDVGINLGEMNAKLLQKIEELTLYIIQQQEQLDEQRILIGQLIENQSK